MKARIVRRKESVDARIYDILHKIHSDKKIALKRFKLIMFEQEYKQLIN